MKVSYRALQKFFPTDLPAVAVVTEALSQRAFEVEDLVARGDDWEFEVKILPDRAADAKSELGLARELSAVLNLPLKDEYSSLPTAATARATIRFSADDLNLLLGIALGEHEIIDLLRRVRVVVSHGDGDGLVALIPGERQDLNLKEDLADEVARLYGYDRIPAQPLPPPARAPVDDPAAILADRVREFLVSEGYTEMYGYTFRPQGEVAIEKPLASDKAFLRTNLADGLREVLQANLRHVLFETEEVKLFEIGTVFAGGEERIHVAVGRAVKKPQAILTVDEAPLSDWAEKVGSATGNLLPFLNRTVNYQPLSPYPRIIRDVAVWVPAVTEVEEVRDLIRTNAGDLLAEGPVMFDEFKKDDRVSLAFRLALQSRERTLEDGDANQVMDRVNQALESRGWGVRK